MRVGVGDVCAFLLKQGHDFHCRRFAGVVDVLFIGKAEYQYAAALDGFAMLVQGVGGFLDYPVRHVVVYLAGQFDEAGVDAIFLGFPGQVEGVDGDAMSTEAGAWGVRHEAEGLCGSSLDHFMDVDAHFVGDDLHFVDQADVNGPVDVLQQLAHFGHFGAADRYCCGNGFAVEHLAQRKTGSGGAADDFGDVGCFEMRVAGVFSLGGVDQRAVMARNEAAVAQSWFDELFGCTGPGSAFQTEQLAIAEIGQDAFYRVDDEAEVGLMMLIERSGDADDLCVQFACETEVCGCSEARPKRAIYLRRGDALDVAVAAVQCLDLVGVDIESRNADTHFCEA